MAITTSSILSAPVQESFNMKLLSVPTPNFIHKVPAKEYEFPRNGGTTMRFRRPNRLNPALVPLGNSGVTPPGQTLTALDIDAEMSFYGDYLQINEQVVLQNQENVLNEAALVLGIALRETEDTLTRNMLAGTAAAINCVGGVNGDNPTEVSRSDVNDVIRTLLSADAYTVLDTIEGEDKYGTAPVRNSYFALCHTNLTGDLDAVNGFVHNSQYPNRGPVLPSEWGAISNLRFLVSSIGSITSTASNLGADVYNIFCVGMEAYACIEQDGYSAQFIYLPAQFSGPLAQNVSLGYKFAQVPRILNEAWVLNLRATRA